MNIDAPNIILAFKFNSSGILISISSAAVYYHALSLLI
jgi:hypothetical protein